VKKWPSLGYKSQPAKVGAVPMHPGQLRLWVADAASLDAAGQLFGDPLIHAVRILVDPDMPGVFGFLPLIVAENGPF
jgi:hypothetical protein